ncbi:S8 family serine peptidase [Phocaeicola barnesiae]|uniref:S8 family peptidase n=1 Tax=Phocaeicola barnesiae TaxID=376804 RepID=UPI001F208054|nr:S8 family serine peptidase [Phocaeicola barnesiae]MCF2599733.1 S8 family serine peptidase [Phocaeicola barnesiae]
MDSKNQNKNQANTPRTPFWMPWGAGGCLWRTVVFLLGMCLISLFLALLLRGCGDKKQNNGPVNPDGQDSLIIVNKDTVPNPYYNLPPELRDTSIVRDWNEPIPGVDELPIPERNFIPPIDSTQIITDPEDSVSQIVCDRLIVLFKSTPDKVKEDMASFARQFKQQYPGAEYQILYYNSSIGTMNIGVPQSELIKVADELPQKITGLDFLVTTEQIINGASKPSDPGFSVGKYDEYFKLIQAYDAWDITRGSKDVKVAIVDSYFDLSNPEIGERYVDPINIATGRVNVLPPAKMPASEEEVGLYCHGSHVAGLAIGGQNNGLGCSGIAPECSWIPIALGSYPWSTMRTLEGVLYAIYHGADVINLSIGGISPLMAQLSLNEQVAISQISGKRGEAVWDYIVEIANRNNCIICKASGNESVFMGLDFMNRSDLVINVEAVDNQGIKADFSNFGVVDEVGIHYSAVAAPGVKLWSVSDKRCAPFWYLSGVKVSAKDGFQEMDGTSMAAPVVTGAVALLKSKNKDLTAAQARKILIMTGKQTDTQHRIGPTIQIRDALDATGGDLLNFDDLMKDHNKLLGKWKSTYEINLVEVDTEKKVDEMWTYFIFTSTTSGRLEYHAIGTKRIYTAPVSVKWGTNQLTIIQHGDAVSSDGKQINKDDFVCHPNQERLLETSCQRNGKERYTFLLEKVN